MKFQGMFIKIQVQLWNIVLSEMDQSRFFQIFEELGVNGNFSDFADDWKQGN